ncbi:MAG: hypothetical protein KBS59_06880 [Clostridiales bacterium]|nr:hypothetical protein [Clostridiales bacterium]
MFKKTTKFFVGIAFLVQAFTALVMFFITLGKKKSLSGALLGVAAVTGVAGGYLVHDAGDCADDEKCYDCECTGDCETCECGDDCAECPCADDDVDINEKGLFSRDDEADAE